MLTGASSNSLFLAICSSIPAGVSLRKRLGVMMSIRFFFDVQCYRFLLTGEVTPYRCFGIFKIVFLVLGFDDFCVAGCLPQARQILSSRRSGLEALSIISVKT
jgi:hypothetical protein